MINFKDLPISIEEKTTEVKIGETSLAVRNYLPIDKKSELMIFIINNALDNMTGCFSPIRTEVYFGIAVCSYYADITFSEEDLKAVGKTYDMLDQSGLLNKIIDAIPQEEYEFLTDLVDATTSDVARYNSSAAGIIQSMGSNADDLGKEVTSLLEKIQNKDGLEMLSVIKDVVGKD